MVNFDRLRRLPRWTLPLTVLVVGSALTLAGTRWLDARIDKAQSERLRTASAQAQLAVIDALTRPVYGLAGLRAAVAVKGRSPTTRDMQAYVGARDMPREFPGTRGFGVVERVRREDLAAFVGAMELERPDGFSINTRGSDPELYVVRAIEPERDNLSALGFDIGSEPVRRQAVLRAMQTGAMSLSGPITLMVGPASPAGLIVLPVFASGSGRADGSPVVSAVVAPLLYAPLVSAALPANGHVRLDLLDLDAPPHRRQVFSSAVGAGIGAFETVDFEFGGRRFLARYQALPALYGDLQGVEHGAMTLLGLLLSLVTAAMAALLVTSRAQAIDRADGMAHELSRLAMVAKLTSNSVVVTDAAGRIEWANPAFEALTGYPLDQLRHRKPGDVLQFEESSPDTIAAVHEALQSTRPITFEILNRSAAGRAYLVQIEIQPIIAADGGLEGYIGVQTDITETRRQAEALRENEAMLQRINKVAGVVGWELELATGQLTWSDHTRGLHEVPDDFVPQLETAIQFYAESARPVITAAVNNGLATGEGWDLELPLVSWTGRRFWARAVGEVLTEGGKPVRLVGGFQDITSRKLVEQDLAENKRLTDITLRSIGEGVLTTDVEGRVVSLNQAAQTLTGWTQADAGGLPSFQVLHLEHEESRASMPSPIMACLAEKRVVGASADTCLVARDQTTEHAIEYSCSPLLDDSGELLGSVLVFNDVTEKRRLASEMRFRATHDALTGLINRGELEVRLGKAVARTHEGGAAGALMFMDLDHFKIVNDNCGHGAGDNVLRSVAQILESIVRRDDTVARFGGDEFVVVLERCPMDKAVAIAQRLCDSVNEYRYVSDSGSRFNVGASIGVVILDARWPNVSTMLQVVDEACYGAKTEGRGRVLVADDNLPKLQGEHMAAWGGRVENALHDDGFELHAQRIVPIDGRSEALRCEILLRMRSAERGLVSPGVFMPCAERYQLASRIDRWVIRKLLDTLAGRDLGAIQRISVNVSGQSVGDREFHRFVQSAIQDSGIRPDVLEFEITETSAVTHLTRASQFIEQMREMGVELALDDFGAGSSSFAYLKRLHVDVLKIDGHFVKGMLDCPLDKAAVRCFSEVATLLGIRTVAEHVEDAATCEALRALGVNFAQGYHFHKPEPFEDLLRGLA